MKNREKIIHIRVTDKEFDIISNNSTKLEITKSEYCRSLILKQSRKLKVNYIVKSIFKLKKTENNISNNINQLTKKIHTLNYVSEETKDSFIKAINESNKSRESMIGGITILFNELL